MLTLHHNIETGQTRLLIQNPFATAWIAHYRRLTVHMLTSEFCHEREVHNWRLYVERSPSLPPSAAKSSTQLLIESRLRAWLLQRFRCRLRDMSFEDLAKIAERCARNPAREWV